MKCRLCESSKLKKYLDLGYSPAEDAFLSKEDLSKPEVWYPLTVMVCGDCGFSQLGFVAPLEAKFGDKYVYDTAATPAGFTYYNVFAKEVSQELALHDKSFVIDIGSNTGVLLEAFNKYSQCKILGVDPAPIVARMAQKKGVDTIIKPFTAQLAKKIRTSKGRATLITGTNVFAHIDDLSDIMKGINILLKDEGIFIFESPHFLRLVNNYEYDTIYHGHASYISITPLVKFLNKFGMEIIRVKETSIHGGSIRVSIARKGQYKISNTVKKVIHEEKKAGILKYSYLIKWSQKVKSNQDTLVNLLLKLKLQGKRIVGVGAPAKSTTLLTSCQIGTSILDYVTDKNILKIGKYTPGMHIPIYSDEHLLSDMPDYAIILPWNFASQIIDNLQLYMKKGGKFIIPNPVPKIIKEKI